MKFRLLSLPLENMMNSVIDLMDKLLVDANMFRSYCDPAQMSYEDHLVWEKWNKFFNPENYDEKDA